MPVQHILIKGSLPLFQAFPTLQQTRLHLDQLDSGRFPTFVLLQNTFFLLRWVDNKKCIFSVEIEAVTSVHTENEQLDTFLSKTAGLQLGQKPARVADQVLLNG